MSKPGDISSQPQVDLEDAIDKLAQRDEAKNKVANNGFITISDLEDYVHELLDSLPKISRKRIRVEMENMIVPIKQVPHTSDLNKGLAVAQGYKDRLAEIYLMAMRDYRTRNRCIEMLLDAYNTVSKASSADKRKGEASLKYAVLILQLQTSENFMKEVEHMLANVKSAMDGISRQITVYDLQLKLGDVRRGPSGDVEEAALSNGEIEWNSDL